MRSHYMDMDNSLCINETDCSQGNKEGQEEEEEEEGGANNLDDGDDDMGNKSRNNHQVLINFYFHS